MRLAVLLVSLVCSSAFAANRLVPYQGRLEQNGAAVNGSFSMQFSLYTAASGGSAIWTETQAVAVAAGVFSVTLGVATPLPESIFLANPDVYLSIAVKGSEANHVPLSNRQKLHAVPYAVKSEVASSHFVSQSVLIQSATNGAIPRGDNQVVIESKDGNGNPRLELRQDAGFPYIDLGNSNEDYSTRLGLVAGGEFRIQHGVSAGPQISFEAGANGRIILRASSVVLPCRSGFTAAVEGRLCVGPLMAAADGHAAQDTCRGQSPGARVCTHADLQQACASISGFLPGAGAGWYGDLGDADNIFHVWNFNTCTGDNTGVPKAAFGNSLPFRCCY